MQPGEVIEINLRPIDCVINDVNNSEGVQYQLITSNTEKREMTFVDTPPLVLNVPYFPDL